VLALVLVTATATVLNPVLTQTPRLTVAASTRQPPVPKKR